MLYYLMAFSTSLTFVAISESQFKKNKNKSGVLFSIIAIFIVCWLAGIRGYSVGTDVLYYAVPQFEYAKQFSDYFSYMSISQIEPLYALIVFLTSKFCSDVSVLLFLSQLLVLVPIYIVLYKKKNSISITFGMFIYYFLFYNLTLNIMRQSIACAFLMLSYIYYEEGSKKTCLLCTIIAVLFHDSAIIAVVLYILLSLIVNSRVSFIKQIFYIVITVIIILNIQSIVDVLTNQICILPIEYYKRFVSRTNTTNISVFEIIFRSVFVFLPVILFILTKAKDKFKEKYNYFSLIGYVISFMVLVSEYLIRFSYYFQFFFVLTIPSIPKSISRKGNMRIIVYTVLGIIILCYWYVIYILWGWHGTVPFVLK